MAWQVLGTWQGMQQIDGKGWGLVEREPAQQQWRGMGKLARA